MKVPNLPIIAIGIYWWQFETAFFGWNRHPESVAELFADGLALVFFAIAFAFPHHRQARSSNHGRFPRDLPRT